MKQIPAPRSIGGLKDFAHSATISKLSAVQVVTLTFGHPVVNLVTSNYHCIADNFAFKEKLSGIDAASFLENLRPIVKGTRESIDRMPNNAAPPHT